MEINLINKDVVAEYTTTLINKIEESVVTDFINEVKTYDVSHGAKLGKKILNNFFTNIAPKMNSLADVEHALLKLYRQNNVETTTQGIRQVISNYKKRVDLSKQTANKKNESFISIEDCLQENALTGLELKKREEIVKSMKKDLKAFKKRYGDDAKAMIYATATKLAKGD